MLLSVYKTMMRASTPLLEAYLKKRAARGKEDAARAGERRGRAGRSRAPGPLLWFHAASVGEAMSLLSVIGWIVREYAEAAVMVTTGTVTSAKLMADRLPPGAFHQYIPVDHPAWVEKFLDYWRPDFVVWSESELWPAMLTAIGERKIPAVLLNARMSESSFARWKWARGTAREILSVFSISLAQNEAEAARLKELGAQDVRISANLKYGAPPLPADAAKLSALREATSARPLLLFASTHAGEEDIAARLHRGLKKDFPTLLTVIAPRHPPRGQAVLELVQKAGLAAQLRSTGALPLATDDVYVADTLGELGILYRLCKNVVVGGSFAPIGGHNPIEPGQLGCVIFYGPVMHNFITINQDFLGAKAAVQVQDEDALRFQLESALAHPNAFTSYADAALKMTEEKSTAAQDVAALLAPCIDKALGVVREAEEI